MASRASPTDQPARGRPRIAPATLSRRSSGTGFSDICAGRNRTSYLQVMSLASYRCSTAHLHLSRQRSGRLPTISNLAFHEVEQALVGGGLHLRGLPSPRPFRLGI